MAVSLEIESARDVRQHLDRAAWIAFILVFVLTGGSLLAATMLHLPAIAALAFPLVFSLASVVHSPAVGLYALFAAALLIAVQPLTFAGSITDIPFFLNLSEGNSLNLSGFGITPAEILMLTTFAGLIGGLAATRKAPLPAGRLMLPYLVFGVAVVIGEVNGLVHGGDFKLSLWELRPQVYGLAVFVMATLLIRDRSQLKILLAILLLAEVVKAGEGVFRYFITLGPQVGTALATNQAHEDSYLLALFLLAIVIGLIWLRRPLIVLLIAVSPLVFTAIVVNHRRAGLLGLGLEIVAAMVLAYIVEPRFRRGLVKAGVVMVVLGTAFLLTFWNQQYGSIGEVVRPIKSLIDPSARDLSSDLYRIAESANLRATYRTSPLLGIGFGHPYYVFYPQNGAAQYDPLWNIIPHNTVLWIPMRLGIVGLVSFWCLMSMAIIDAIWTMRTVPDKFIRASVLFALAGIFGALFNGYVDVGLESYRNMIVVGVMLAVINRAAHLAGDQQPPNEDVGVAARNRPVFGDRDASERRVRS